MNFYSKFLDIHMREKGLAMITMVSNGNKFIKKFDFDWLCLTFDAFFGS
jgi:hypothetical protein